LVLANERENHLQHQITKLQDKSRRHFHEHKHYCNDQAVYDVSTELIHDDGSYAHKLRALVRESLNERDSSYED
jgi:hypothetical protein